MITKSLTLVISQGRTLAETISYSNERLIYKDVTAIPVKAPARLTVPGHGLPAPWPVRIESAKAPLELNSAQGAWRVATPVDVNTVELNDLNLLNKAEFQGPAVMVFQEPADLTGWVIRMQIRASVGGGVLIDASSDPADGAQGTITIDPAASAFTLTFTAAQTAALDFDQAVYDIEAVRPDGVVVTVISQKPVSLNKEVTVWA